MDISEACVIVKGLLKAFEEYYHEEIKRYENFGTAIEDCKEAVHLVTDAAKEKEKAYETICEAYRNPENAEKVLRKYILSATYASIGQPIYLCDHARNPKCSKECCVANGGPCNATTNVEFAELGPDDCPIIVGYHLTPEAEKDVIEKFGEEVLYGDDTEVETNEWTIQRNDG